MIGGKGENDTLFCFSAFSIFMLHTEQVRSRRPGAGGGSGVAHQAWRAGEGLAHAHALLLVDAECVGLDGQLVLQPALGHYQQLERVLRLPQSQLEGLQGVVDGEHLVHEPAARADEKAQFTELVSTDTPTRCQELCHVPETAVSKTDEAQRSGKTEVEQAEAGGVAKGDEHKGRNRMFRETIWWFLSK